ncbi:M1 family metallopeptidase [Oceanivirga miroungae]|uniref:Aminopeptidase n=1 Tax=Oceanivirga miroungae TaxID=1130046 RepID=A0A6I8M6E5_9FUSO|nr:M1 family metallopeptidase [Oceanivirga miroungae]VWL85015.1 Aminopeptidase N [Oceanivirga miroungae]
MNKVERLIEKFVPEIYDIFLDINRAEKTFSGIVKVKGIANDKKISLHQKKLNISSVGSYSFSVDDKREAVDIVLDKTGEVELEIKFSGVITDNMTGMYPSYYTENGVKKEIISTQFESHFAREVFPCIDEPEAKAVFKLNIKFDKKENENSFVISNMPEIEVEKREQDGIYRFEKTPKMSSYLLAFAVGDMQSKKAKTNSGVEIGIFSTRAHKLEELDFALDIAVRSVEFYEKYFGVKYPLPHSYHVALPDFSAGAMENWGLITYREVYLLVNKNSSVSSRQQVALVIAHEVAHQWFGNLVTMKWWDDLWLNESFANMMEYVCIDSIEPSWNILEDFQTSGVLGALKRDAVDGVQSVHVEVKHPDEIVTLFDPAIVYAKGSRLMHQLRRWLGDENFSSGLGEYFKKNSYSNTIGKNLWDALSSKSNLDVYEFMNSWLEQPGYPVVSVKKENDKLVISQKQFFIGEHVDKNRMWQVPLNSNYANMPETLKEKEIVIDNYSKLREENGVSFRLNDTNTAHYIVNYDDELLNDILSDLDKLDEITKLQILQDTRLLAEGGYISYVRLLDLLVKFKNESSYLVSSMLSSIIASIKVFITPNSDVHDKFQKIVNEVFRLSYERLGSIPRENDTDEDEMVRQIVLSNMIYANNKDVSEKLEKVYKENEANLEDVTSSIRAFVLINEVKTNENMKLVEKYIDMYANTTDSNFQRQISKALSYTSNEETVDKVISILKNKDIVKPQDLAMSWYAPFLANDFSMKKFWDFACNEWEWIIKTLGGDMSFDRFVIYSAAYFKTREYLDEYTKFFTPKLNEVSLSRSISMGINEISSRVALVEKEKEKVDKKILEIKL